MWKKKKVKQIRNSVAIRHNTRAGVCVSTTNTHTERETGTGTVTVTKRRQAAGSAKRRLSRVARGRLICLNKLCTWITNNSGQRCCLAAETTTHTHVYATPPPLPPCAWCGCLLLLVALSTSASLSQSVLAYKFGFICLRCFYLVAVAGPPFPLPLSASPHCLLPRSWLADWLCLARCPWLGIASSNEGGAGKSQRRLLITPACACTHTHALSLYVSVCVSTAVCVCVRVSGQTNSPPGWGWVNEPYANIVGLEASIKCAHTLTHTHWHTHTHTHVLHIYA